MFNVKYSVIKNDDFILDWFLDSVRLLAVNKEKIKIIIEGWVLGNENHEVNALYVKDGDHLHQVDLNVSRRDVLKKHSKANSASDLVHPYCGFNSALDVRGASLELGVVLGGEFINCARLDFIAPGVIISDSGWIFLDKDTNGSVEQFQGVRRVSSNWEDCWSAYFSEVGCYLSERCRYTFLLAPSKEEVLSEHYPFVRGKRTLVDRWLESHASYVTWPLDELRNERYLCYDAAETHWTDHGANLALSRALDAMGEGELSAIRPQYEVITIRGDLGDKVSPVIKSVRLKTLPASHAALIEDNGIVNHGNIKLFKNLSAVANKKLLIFGGSSSNYLLAHAANIFADVMFVHTTGGVDKSIVESFAPDFVVLQTNQRFIVTPPSPFVDVGIYANKISEKSNS